MSEKVTALGCTWCKYIWKPRYPRKPRVCPRCHRHEGKNVHFVYLKVPESYFQKKAAPIIEPFALPEIAHVTCTKCQRETSRGGIIDQMFLCPDCVLEEIMSRPLKVISWKEIEVIEKQFETEFKPSD